MWVRQTDSIYIYIYGPSNFSVPYDVSFVTVNLDVDKDGVQSPDETLEKKGQDDKDDTTSGVREEKVDVEDKNETNIKDVNDSAMSSTEPISPNNNIREDGKTIGM